LIEAQTRVGWLITVIIIIFVYFIADIPRNLTLLTSTTQGGAIYRVAQKR